MVHYHAAHASLQEPETQRAVATSGSLRLVDMFDEKRHVYYCNKNEMYQNDKTVNSNYDQM